MKKRLKFLLPFAALLAVSLPLQPAAAEVPELDLSPYAGKIVYLDFWASWCAPCRRSFPWMNDMLARYADAGLAVVSVNVDAERKLADEFLAETPANFPVIYDPEGKLAAQWQLVGMPSSYLIGPDGNVISRHVGFRSESPEKYEAEIRRLLKLEESK